MRTENGQLSGLRLVAHPLRIRMLSLLTGRTLSAAEVARELDQNHANVSYHLRRLLAGNLIQLVDEVQIRGGRAKRYTHRPDSGETVNGGDRDEMRQLLAVLANRMMARGEQYQIGSAHAFTDAEVSVSVEARYLLEHDARELGRRIADAATSAHDGPRTTISATIALFEIGPVSEQS